MKRKIYSDLLAWKNEKEFKPLLILGVRQCGKTYIVDEFCKNEYKNYKKVNLFEDTEIVNLYKSNKKSIEKYNQLKLLLDFDFDKEDSILFIDEIQECEELISELKYFNENHSNVRIICAGSLLGVKLARLKRPFPVGKVKRLYLHPMDFEEFLLAYNKDSLIESIKECFKNDKSIGTEVHEMTLNYYRRYLLSGGLPESVKNIVKCDNDYFNYDLNILNSIIEDYKNDMNNHVTSTAETLKIRKIYSSLPSQLTNASKKFMYSNIEKNAKSREYYLPLNWLEESNMIQICKCIKKPEKPLLGFTDEDTFKVYFSDVGIFNRIVDNDTKDIILNNMKIYKGIITENYVANQLKASKIPLLYWKGARESEIDFLLSTKDGIIPIEVKAENNTQSKSLKIYDKLYNPKYMIRVSTKDFGYNPETKIKSVPLYAVFLLKNLIK